jgi:cytochrome c oxidase cbb3-type subunit 3
MSDFDSSFWNWYISIGTILSMAACFWLLRWVGSGAKLKQTTTEDTGHVWDGDLRELNNPLPRWWLGMFYISLVFSAGYLLLYPGLGTFEGLLGWTSRGEYEEEVKIADAKFGALYEQYQAQDIATLAKNPKAQKMGERLFANHCATCHGSDARGARGFPNLRDDDWLWGGEPANIEQTILDGRVAGMPAWGIPLGGEAGVSDVTDYVLSLSDRTHDAEAALRGQEKFNMFCIGCHGVDGKGNVALGAPNLTDKTWLYGASRLRISETIDKGRQGHMPAHRDFLGEVKVHLLAAYIYGLSNTP